MEQNPLETFAESIISATNKRGRPLHADTKQFSCPQPKSAIISEILKQKSLKNTLLEETVPKQNWQDADNVEDDFHLAAEEDVKEYEIELEVICKRNKSRYKNKTKSVKKPKKHFKESKDKQEKRFACDYPNCTYAAKLSCNLVKHKRRHTSEKPYICDQCPFRTNFINSLKVHRRIHTEEKPYNCEHCGYRCNTSSNLKKHRMHRHPEVAKI